MKIAPDLESQRVLDGEWVVRGAIRVFVPAAPKPQVPRKRYKKHPRHGSVAGYRRHQKANEPPCDECLAATREHWRKYKRRVRRPPSPPSPCGTYNAYKRHQRHGETPCDECAEAQREYNRDYRRRVRANARAGQQIDEREAA